MMNASDAGHADPVKPQAMGERLAFELREIGIPPRPEILNRINQEIKQDEPDFKLLAALISSDVSLSSGLIKTANSPYFGFRTPVRSVSQALTTLGLNVASRTIAGLSLRLIFPHAISMQRFWGASSRIARLSGWLAQRYRAARVKADDAYTFGLFRDCGIPLLLFPFPDYRDILKLANAESELLFTDIEDHHLQTNHALIGSQLGENWLLPDELNLAILNHHNVMALREPGAVALPQQALGLIALAQLAEHLVQHHTGLSQTQEWKKMGADCLRLLAIGVDELADLYADSAEIVASEE